MGWPREGEFKELLDRCARKSSKGLLDELASLAVADDKQCYKLVVALVEKALGRAAPAQRLNVLYALSAICRRSKALRGSRDKYVARFEPGMAKVAAQVAEVPEASAAQVAKLVSLWQHEDVFVPAMLARFGRNSKPLARPTGAPAGVLPPPQPRAASPAGNLMAAAQAEAGLGLGPEAGSVGKPASVNSAGSPVLSAFSGPGAVPPAPAAAANQVGPGAAAVPAPPAASTGSNRQSAMYDPFSNDFSSPTSSPVAAAGTPAAPAAAPPATTPAKRARVSRWGKPAQAAPSVLLLLT
ncbi:hypothetical protein WJX81_005139 [Elliptochloris bilobata]|uniref:CID domain-containing protein n=1 Tax=Elliptochloris bilobata TaxID=381761 RepID=A0AAW1RCF8_9CHLO